MRTLTTALIVLAFAGALAAVSLVPRVPDQTVSVCPGPVPLPPPTIGTRPTLTYSVGGMHCTGCAEAIMAEVKEVPGVESVVCSFETRSIVVMVGTSDLRPAVERAITKLGYTIAPAGEPASSK